MTQEQKEQLAREGVTIATNTKRVTQEDLYHIILWALNARDEEVEELQGKVEAMESYIEAEKTCMQEELDEMQEQLKMNAENIQRLKAELDKAKNPWVSVEERLPEITNPSLGESDFVFIRAVNKDTGAEWIELPAKYNEHFHDWQTNDFTWIGKRSGVVTHWMPIPKGGEG